MVTLLTEHHRRRLAPGEALTRLPVSSTIVSNGEFNGMDVVRINDDGRTTEVRHAEEFAQLRAQIGYAAPLTRALRSPAIPR